MANEQETKEEHKVNSEDREGNLGHKPRIKPIIEAADSLSLGISMVVAVVMGVGIGYLLRSMTGVAWLFWIGVAIGIAAAISNVYKAYSKQYKAYEELAKEPRYAIKKKLNEKDKKQEKKQEEDDDEDSFWEDDYGEEKNY